MIAHTKEELWFWWSPTICSCALYLAQLFLGTTHLYCAPTDRSYLSPSTTWSPFRKYFIASVLWSFKLHGSTTLFGRLSKTAVFPNWLLSHFALGCALWNIPTCSLCNPGTSWWTLLYWGETKRKGQEGPLDYMCRISQWIKFTFTAFLCMWKVAA